MKIALCAATNLELDGVKKLVADHHELLQHVNLNYYTTGVGLMHATYSLGRIFGDATINLVLQIGIAGSFDTALSIGTLFVVENEYCGDLGVEENGTFRDVFDMNLIEHNTVPYVENKLYNPWLRHYNLPNLATVDAVTVNEVTTNKSRIDQLRIKYNCDAESMEGAALHYVGLQSTIPFLQIRTVSNFVGERDKAKWNIPLALDNLSKAVTHLLIDIDKSIAKNMGEPMHINNSAHP